MYRRQRPFFEYFLAYPWPVRLFVIFDQYMQFFFRPYNAYPLLRGHRFASRIQRYNSQRFMPVISHSASMLSASATACSRESPNRRPTNGRQSRYLRLLIVHTPAGLVVVRLVRALGRLQRLDLAALARNFAVCSAMRSRSACLRSGRLSRETWRVIATSTTCR